MKQRLRELLLPQPKSKIKAGDGLTEGAYNFYTSSQIQSKFYPSATYSQPALIFGTGGMASVHYCDQPFSTSTDCLVMYGNPETNLELIYQYLRTNIHILQAGFKGAGLQHISKDYILDIEIDMPEVPIQEKIAVQMRIIDGLITRKKQQAIFLDDAVKSRFVELFGDPVTNPKRWEMPLIEDVVANEKNALKAGPFGSALKKEYYVSSGYKIYGQEQVICGDPTFGDYYIDEERYKLLENCAVQAGDVLISLVGTYGKLLIMPEEFEPGIINPRLMKITFDKKRVNPYYFQHYFQSDSLKKALAENTHGGTMDILNLGIVRKLAMPLPPLELQNQFILFVAKTDKSKYCVLLMLTSLEFARNIIYRRFEYDKL